MARETPKSLDEARARFIDLWGQMGSTWGIPRTMAQVHAFLLAEGEPRNTDDVMAALAVSRGSASMTLRALVDWGIVYRTHLRGDRKEYFIAEQDVWTMFRTILAERKKREIDPLLAALAACTFMPDDSRKVDADAAATRDHNERIESLSAFFSLIDSISQRFISPSGAGLELAAKLLDRAS